MQENGLRIIDDEFEYDYVFALEKVPNLDENINEKSKAIMRNTEMLEKFKKRIKKNSTILIKTVEDLNDELILYEVQDRAQPIQLIQLYYTPFVNNRRYCTIRRCGNYRICCKDNPNFYLDLEVTESNDYCHSEIVDPILTITQTSSEDFRLYAQHEDLNATIYMTISPDTGHFSNYNTQNPIMLGKYIEDKLLYIFIQTAYGYKKLVKELNKIRLFKCPIQLNVMDQHGNNLSFQSSPNELEFQLKLNKVATFKIPPNINRISMNGVCSNSIIIGRLFSKHDVSSPLQVIRSPSFSLNLFVQSNKNLLAITSNISNKKNDEYIIELFRKADQNDEKITEKRMIPQNFYVFKDCDISFGSYQVILTRTPKEEDGNSENHTTEKFNSNIVQFENDNGLRRRHLGTVKKNGGILYYSLEFATIQEDEFSW
ncbi:hypothetical protein SNEBB_005301 [Seison nebaliae]|nr:hypothetical protein SNEBB_005301 [Seison nebaliae]